MKNRFPAALLSACVALVSAMPSGLGQQARENEAKQEPSLAETKAWIKQTFGEGSHFVHKARVGISFDELDKMDDSQCWVRFLGYNLDDGQIRFMQMVNLENIDPTSVKIGELTHDSDITTVRDPGQIDYSTFAVKDHPYVFVRIKTTNDVEKVYDDTFFRLNGKTTKTSSKENEVGFPQEGIALTPEYAPRFVKALVHAVQLCGGKPSAF